MKYAHGTNPLCRTVRFQAVIESLEPAGHPIIPLPPLPPSLFLYLFWFSRQETIWPSYYLNDSDVSQTSGSALSGEELAVVAMVIFQGGGGGI